MVFKRIFAVLTAAALLLAMSSCGGDEAKRPEPELTEDGKKIVKIYALWVSETDTELYGNINDFNKASKEYEILLTDYKDFDEPLTRLNTDITTGNSPDILICTNGLPLKSYNNKRLIADLYEFIDSDPDMKREDFLGSFLKACETDGKLLKTASSFYIDTIVGKTSLAGEKQGMTAEEFMELAESFPDKKLFSGDDTKRSVFFKLTLYGYKEYVDPNTGECRFNSEEFIRLLEFCNRFPNETDGNDSGKNILSDKETDLYNGNTLFSSDYIIGHFGTIRQLEQGIFGEPVTFTGYPGIGGNGAALNLTGSEYMIMSHAANKEGAWEFLKYILSEEYQDRISEENLMFPVRMSSLEKAAEEAKKGNYDSDKGEYTEPVWVLNGNIIKLGVNTDGDNQKIFELLDSATGVSGFESAYVYNIMSEESAAYFSGQKSAKEVAEIIQNRVQNYLDESR